MRNSKTWNVGTVCVMLSLGLLVTACGDKKKKKKLCQGAAAKQCLVKGVRLQSKGGEQNMRTALGLYELTCDGKGEWAMKGCTLAAHLHRLGKDGVKKDEKKALKLYEKACDVDRPGAYLAGPACFRAGNAYALGYYGTKIDAERGRKYLEAACKDGDKDACKFAKMMRSYTGENSTANLIKKCEKGHARSCGEVGWRHYKGNRGTDKNGLKAVTYFTKGCDGKYAGACGMLGLVYEKGVKGVPKNATLSRRYYRKGCDGGVPVACVNLASELLLSRKDEAQVKEGATLLRTWCNKRRGRACKWLGVAYKKGYGVRRSRYQAKRAFRKACRLGDKQGCKYARAL